MKYIQIFFMLLLVVAANTIQAQTKKSDAHLLGHVVHETSKEHLPYIVISIKGTTISTMTDASGHFVMRNLPTGEFTLVASSMGYETQEMKVKIEANTSTEINFIMADQIFEIEQVVVSSNKNETNKKTSSAIVNVTSTKLFEATASSNLAETMNFQSGLRVENNCGNCGITQLRINGLDGQYSQVLLDSRPIFSSLSSVYGLEQMPLAMVERVEVVRGGGSALFGSNAIGGVVNIITKEPRRNSLTLSNTTNVLQGGTTDVNTSLNGSFVSDDYKAGVYLFGMVKNRGAYDRNGDGFSDVPELDSETLGFRGYYKTSPYTKLTAEYHHIREFRRGGDNLDNPPHTANIAEQLTHNIDGGGLSFDYFSPNYRHKLGVYTSAQVVSRDSYFGVNQNPDAYGHTDDQTFVAGTQYTYGFNKCLFMPAELTAGVEYNYNNLHDKILGYNRNLQQTTHIVGAFVQNEWKSEKLNFLIGGRLDKHNLMKNVVFSPRVNVRYSPTKNIGLRASYSSGYRAPQSYNEDLHVDAVSGTIALIQLDPNLKPEYSHSLSASADLYHSFGRVQANLLLEGFYTVLNDVFTLVKIGENADGNIIMERRNASGAKVSGVSAELKLGIADRFEVQMGYTHQKSLYKEAEQWSDDLPAQRRMFRSPDTYGYLTANYNVTKNFRTSLFGNYTGSMLVQHNKGYIEHDAEKITPDFWDMGLRLSYNFAISKTVNLEVNCGVKNILDSYQNDLDFGVDKDAVYVYGPSLPRTYFVGLKFTL